eukprot:s718_g15.t1
MLSQHLPAELLWGAGNTPRTQTSFELLGAAIGSADFIAAHTAVRAAAASTLLKAISELDDPQVGVRLMRSCAGHSRLLHSMRCVPPTAQEFDQQVRSCFSSLRSAQHDGSAAYLASLGASQALCGRLDQHNTAASWRASAHASQALALFNASLPAPQDLSLAAALGKTQKALTQILDQAGWHEQLSNCSLVAQALLHSEAEPGSRAFLAARPHGHWRLEPAVFVTA